VPGITGALPGGRWAIIACEGSMAITHRSGRFVRARPRPDVDDGAGITETGADGGGQARVWPAVPAVAGADAVVDRRVRAAGRRGIRAACPDAVELGLIEAQQAAFGDAIAAKPVQPDRRPLFVPAARNGRLPVCDHRDMLAVAGQQLGRLHPEGPVGEVAAASEVGEDRVDPQVRSGKVASARNVPRDVRAQHLTQRPVVAPA